MSRQNPLGDLWAQLRERRVLRVAAVYAAAAFVVLQVADLVAEPLRLPEWTMALLIVLAAAGFVLAVVLAWMFQVGPAGIERAQPATVGSHSRSVAFVGLGIVLGLGVVGSAGFLATRDPLPTRATDDAIGSIAVLPFVNLSAGDEDYFADGLAEELLDALASIEQLRVPARTSSFAFKGQNVDVREIGRRLGVEVVLEGSVRRAGDRLRVSAQLVDVATGYTVFTDTWERTVDDVFAVQTELSRAILTAIRLNPDDEGEGAVMRAGTRDPRAHDLYLAGLYHFHRRGANVDSALTALRAATELDPDYADAWAGLAATLSVAPFFLDIDLEAGRAEGTRAAERALALDPDHAQAYAALGQLAETYDWDTERALRHYRRSLELAPGDANTRLWYGAALLMNGNIDDALVELYRAREMDPLSAVVAENVGAALSAAGRVAEAIPEYERGLQLNPGMLTNRWAGAIMMARIGRCADAARFATTGLPDDPTAAGLRVLFAAPCDASLAPTAQAIATAWSASYGVAGDAPSDALVIAFVFDLAGDIDQAELWLQRAYEGRRPSLPPSMPAYLTDELVARPAVRAMVRQMDLDWIYDARRAAAARRAAQSAPAAPVP